MANKVVRLRTPKGVDKGLYVYERVRPDYVQCWKQSDSKSNSYAIRWVGGSWYCDCPARKVCAHILGCPYKGRKVAKKNHAHSNKDPMVRAAKTAMVRLLNGRIVNAFNYFWTKGAAK
jgi:hypothetical protein